jgi:NitT/TauT family transport system ATP-binding protein
MTYESTSINVQNLYKSFSSRSGEVSAVKDITFSVGKGEFFVIVGPSGCGKTTLLRILAGLEEATGGQVVVAGSEQDRPANSMVFQEQSVFPWMTVRDNVAYGLRVRGIPRKERYETAEHYIRMIGLSKFAEAYPHQLSGGMKQRVSVARAFANDPAILLMDEPFGALDEQNRIILQQELIKIWEETRKTAVFITHSIDEAICLGDRVMIMTAHPGTIRRIAEIDLPRPRDISAIRVTPRYNEIFMDIWGTLREEVLKTKQLELGENC